jgi:hypothetical protein
MSTKFEQLLDLIVNEEMDKANELFHEIVVEKSRDIYENLIAEEAEDEEMDESADEEEMDESADEEEMDESADEEEMDESADEEDDMGESVDLEDSYSMEADDEEDMPGDEKTGDFGSDIGATDDEMGGAEGDEDSAIFDIKNAIAELEAAFAELEQAKGMGGDEFGDTGKMDGEEEPMKMGFQEGRRMTREYTEKVGNDWEKNSQKAQGQYLGAGTGEKDGAPVEGRSPISSGAGKPVGGKNVGAGNIVRGDTEGQSNTGDRPAKVNKGINPESSEKFAKGIHNVDGAKSGVKTLSAVKGGHGAEKKGAGPGPVGSGSGDKAGQTSVPKVPQFLKPAN